MRRNAKLIPCFFVLGFIFNFLLNIAEAFASKKIVILAPVISEWTAEILGQEQTLKQVVGVSEYSHYPDYLKKIQTIGPYPQLHIEKIASLHPDLVLGSSESNLSEQIEKLRRLHLNVVLLKKETFQGMSEWIKELGKALEADASATQVAKHWLLAVGKLKVKHHPAKRMLIEVQDEPLITVGGGSFLNDAFSSVGYQNIFSALPQSYPKLSREAVLKEKPDVIFVMNVMGSDDSFEISKAKWKRFLKSDVISISADDFARCSFRLLKGIEALP